MELTPILDHLRSDSASALAGQDQDTRERTLRLLTLLEPSVRLALMEALSQAADEVTAQLPWGQVDVLVKGREPAMRVELPPSSELTRPAPTPPTPPTTPDPIVPTPPPVPPVPGIPTPDSEGEGDAARVSLRIPAALKRGAEDLAARAGQSLNTWIVEAVRRALQGTSTDPDLGRASSVDTAGHPLAPPPPDIVWTHGGNQYTGWI